MTRQQLLSIALGFWLVIGSFIYFRQFVAQGMWFLNKLLGL